MKNNSIFDRKHARRAREKRINDRSTKDIRRPPIVVFVVSCALFCDFLLFVLFNLFYFDGSFLVLMGEEKGKRSPKKLR